MGGIRASIDHTVSLLAVESVRVFMQEFLHPHRLKY
jgi:hypothetical protein